MSLALYRIDALGCDTSHLCGGCIEEVKTRARLANSGARVRPVRAGTCDRCRRSTYASPRARAIGEEYAEAERLMEEQNAALARPGACITIRHWESGELSVLTASDSVEAIEEQASRATQITVNVGGESMTIPNDRIVAIEPYDTEEEG